MKKIDFIKLFAEKANITQKDAREISAAYWDAIFEAMKDEDGVSPVQGVKFVTVHKDSRTARNPLTGESIVVPEKDVPKVKFGASVKDIFK